MNKTKKRLISIVIAIILIAIVVYNIIPAKNPYQFQGNTLSYSENRGSISYEKTLKEEKDNFSIYNINFKTRPFLDKEARIYGLLFLPKNKKDIPAIIFLPAGGAGKESRILLLTMLANKGYASLTIDQRGIGQTGGQYPSMEQDYQISTQSEPIQHLSVYDALHSFDLLSDLNVIDKNNIIMMGESMGGRYALIAAAIDKRIKGVITISTAGYHIDQSDPSPYTDYLVSIDPDHYINKIFPRNVIFFHGTNDSLISPNSAKQTFNLANQPKKFYLAEGCTHGYCDKMQSGLEESLKLIFGK